MSNEITISDGPFAGTVIIVKDDGAIGNGSTDDTKAVGLNKIRRTHQQTVRMVCR